MRTKKKKAQSPEQNTPIEQHAWKEVIVQPELLSDYIEAPDLTEKEMAVIKEAKILLHQLLFDRVIELTSDHFTGHQKTVLALILMPERTYNEVAEILNINYTGISHAIKGIKSNKHGKFHGGYEKKLKKICSKDSYCVEYLGAIKVLRNNDPEEALEILIKYDDNPEDWKNYQLYD